MFATLCDNGNALVKELGQGQWLSHSCRIWSSTEFVMLRNQLILPWDKYRNNAGPLFSAFALKRNQSFPFGSGLGVLIAKLAARLWLRHSRFELDQSTQGWFLLDFCFFLRWREIESKFESTVHVSGYNSVVSVKGKKVE